MLTTPTVINCVCLNEKRGICYSKSCSVKQLIQCMWNFKQAKSDANVLFV